MLSALLMAGAMSLLCKASNLWMLHLYAIIFGFFYGAIDPPVMGFVGDAFGLRHIGVIMGVLVTAWGAGAALGPSLGGYLFDVTGNYFFSFLSGLGSMLLLSALCLLVRLPGKPLQNLSENL